MNQNMSYDAAIIGGGLAGLALSIQLARLGKNVILFEKETYPFHKVCGEYISMESWNFLSSLGLPLDQMNLPKIDTLFLTAPNGKGFETKLPLGGFGISRFLIDQLLADLAKRGGVDLCEATKVENVLPKMDQFVVSFSGEQKGAITAKLCFGAFGKRSNLDVRWKRSFLLPVRKPVNYIGIKYHVKVRAKENTIALHNFKDGYCGFSKIEDDKYCLCYMTTAENLKACDNSIELLQQRILFRNPSLKKLFEECEIVDSFPIAISQINFTSKKPVEKNLVMLGDAAGTIPPVCGNGMSMALHSSKLAAGFAGSYLNGMCTRKEMEVSYTAAYNAQFGRRLKAGRFLQRFFGRELITSSFVGLLKAVPFLAKPIIKNTHGRPF